MALAALWITAADFGLSVHAAAMSGQDFDVRTPFTRAEALTRGITDAQLRGRGYRQVLNGYYVCATAAADTTQRVRAALRIHPPGAFASHLTAARLYGLPVPASSDLHISVFDRNDRRQRTGVRSHVARADTTVELRRGVRVSSPSDTFMALATLLDLVDLVVVGDALVKRGLATPAVLVAAAAHSGERGAIRARKAARYVRAGVDSPMETRLRMLIVLAGLPEPTVNYILRDLAGDWLARFDLSYPDLKLIVEYDGRQHADDAAQWEGDIERREFLADGGWKLVVVTSKGIYREPERTLQRIAEALRRCGCRISAPSDAWRPHFPTA